MQTSLYIHIPFCRYICKYCDFCKKFTTSFDHQVYVEALIQEIKYKKINFKELKTIYIGGGTPSALDQNALNSLLSFIKEQLEEKQVLEYTLECNPDDVRLELIDFLVSKGVNRISLGVQTLNDQILVDAGRNHTSKQVTEAINIIYPQIKNISIDLMFNLPKQSLKDIEDSFEFIRKNQEKINHISYYSLILEEHTIFNQENVENFSEEEEADIYQLIQKNLIDLGYLQYEIANYAKGPYTSKHNQNYWQGGNYYGVGIGASQYVNSKRSTNTKSIKKYVDLINNQEFDLLLMEEEEISLEEEVYEQIMLGLRTNDGILQDLLVQNNIEINELFFEKVEDRIRIKPTYLFLSNGIILDILEQL